MDTESLMLTLGEFLEGAVVRVSGAPDAFEVDKTVQIAQKFDLTLICSIARLGSPAAVF